MFKSQTILFVAGRLSFTILCNLIFGNLSTWIHIYCLSLVIHYFLDISLCTDSYINLIRISSRDTGKTMVDASLGEIMTTCEKITWLLSEGEQWLKPEYRYTILPSVFLYVMFSIILLI